jgi:hypothetical protein
LFARDRCGLLWPQLQDLRVFPPANELQMSVSACKRDGHYSPPTCHVCAHLLCHHKEVVDHMLRLARKLGPQLRVLWGQAAKHTTMSCIVKVNTTA